MIRTLLLALTLFLLYTTEILAQSKLYLGVQANPIYCQPREAGYSDNFHIDGAYSFQSAFRAEYFHKSGFGIGTAVQYVRRTYDFTNTYNDSIWLPTERMQIFRPEYHTIEVPILLSYRIKASDNLGVILSAGISQSLSFPNKEPENYNVKQVVNAGGGMGNTLSFGAGFMVRTEKAGTFRMGYTLNKGINGAYGVYYPRHLDPSSSPFSINQGMALPKIDFMSYDIIWYFLD